jgi:dienelactone hydrolase
MPTFVKVSVEKPLKVATAALLLKILCLTFPAFAQVSPPPVTGLQRSVIFTEYSPLSRSVELARRVFSPLLNIEISRASAAYPLRLQAIDLNQETFVVYVPAKEPPQGYGLLAFIPPWQDARVPPGWADILDEKGVIFVSAAKSGNEENVADRRIPLALLGAYNIMQRYRIDPRRVYVGGFSGGARIALKVALAYPDLFRGALLNAGSDPIGERQAILPPDDLLSQFQSSSRIVFVTGTKDSSNMDLDRVSRNSMISWCMFNTSVETMSGVGHEIAAPDSARRALTALDIRPPPAAAKVSACMAQVAQQMAADLNHVQALLDREKTHEAWRLLGKIDIRYGGLASPVQGGEQMPHTDGGKSR